MVLNNDGLVFKRMTDLAISNRKYTQLAIVFTSHTVVRCSGGKPVAMAMVTMNSVNKTKSGTRCSHVNFHEPIRF